MTLLDSATIARIQAATARPHDATAHHRRAYVEDRKRAQTILTRALRGKGLNFATAQRLAIAALQVAARANLTPELATDIGARNVSRIEDRGSAALAFLNAAGDDACASVASACVSALSDARLAAGVRDCLVAVSREMGWEK